MRKFYHQNYKMLTVTDNLYLQTHFALILGWVFFREWPVDQLFPGALFIVLGGIIIYLRQQNYNKQRERKV